ncbi:30S ribosome-binding factor RbfA [Lachnoclostridium sp. Marseille-P6806]|uniref:30S ribosome-binding factor RbfA n=1 Tax=Lachnoclostridium sp. Marseille-P6806 TaxID=2364793 RepID=UPI0010325040|nr:30S ribosome-binding factor RbfA [Lachnoclostridium sp. Marseille-P6806]
MRKNSVKNRRINDEVQRALASLISREIKDPRISPMTSVTQVEVAPDLKTCKVWISVYGDPESGRSTVRGLESAKGYIRSALARSVNLRNTPELHFILDDSIAYGVEMSQRIDDVIAADRAAEEARDEQTEPAEGTETAPAAGDGETETES